MTRPDPFQSIRRFFLLKFLYSLPGLLAEALPEILADAARMLPFLFVACLVVEYAEHRKGD